MHHLVARERCITLWLGNTNPLWQFSVRVAREEYVTERHMHGLIYLIGLIVVIMFILSLLGLR
jgi:hypothetical protein